MAEEKNAIKKKKEDKVGVKRMLFWQSRTISQGCNVQIMGFLTIYCTDTLQMPAALVGILLMSSKIADAFTDLIAGYIVDKTNTKIGRGRPYELSIIGLWACTWLMFSCPPEFSLAAKSIWILSMYIFVNAIFATFLNASNTVYMVRAFAKQEQYVAIQSYGSIVVMLFIVGINFSFPMLMARIATSAQGWSALLAIFAVPLCVIGLLRFLTIKETNDIDATSTEKVRWKDVVEVLKNNPYIYIVALMTLVYYFVQNMGVNVYYFTYIVKNVDMMGILGLTQIILIPLMFAVPFIIKKSSATKLIIGGLLITCIGLLLNFFALDNFPLLLTGNFFTGIGIMPISMMTPLLIIDCAEYNEWKKRPRLEGTLSSINGFATKLGAAFGTGAMGLLLSASGYTGSGSAMPGSAEMMIRLLYSLIPLGLYVVVMIVLRFYKLDKLAPQIRKENEETRHKS